MRLGDLDALKEQFTEGAYTSKGVREIIDNAPTVETYTIEDIQTVREDALILGAKLAQRPEGEWIEHSDGYISFCTCNKCNGFGYKDDKFCNNCGAKMKGGAE